MRGGSHNLESVLISRFGTKLFLNCHNSLTQTSTQAHTYVCIKARTEVGLQKRGRAELAQKLQLTSVIYTGIYVTQLKRPARLPVLPESENACTGGVGSQVGQPL